MSSKTKTATAGTPVTLAPPSRRGDARRSRRPLSATPPLGTRGASAPPEWTVRARLLVAELEAALRAGADPETVARVERAWAGWELKGPSAATISRVAHLVDRAYVAMHSGAGPQPEEALQGCARILYNGLPTSVRKQTDYPRIVELVRRLEHERELWTAVVRTTAELVGWSHLALTHAGQAIRVAMAAGTGA